MAKQQKKTAVVCGAGGFIGGHLVAELQRRGYWVRGVDIKLPEFGTSSADEFFVLDLRERESCELAVSPAHQTTAIDEVYQLAADMGGMGFIHTAACEIMYNSVLINAHMIDAAAKAGITRYFFSSSVCVYRDMQHGEPAMTEAAAYPALPDNDYGWEKLYSERMIAAFGERYRMAIRVARFQNCYGPDGTWRGGREKAPAALCRKVAEAPDHGAVEVWGDGTAVRSYIYVDDLVRGIYELMHSSLEGPVNIGTEEYVNVNELAATILSVAGRNLPLKHVEGPVGVTSRNFSHERIRSIGWTPRFSLREGIAQTYPWVAEQVRQAAAATTSLREVATLSVSDAQRSVEQLRTLVEEEPTAPALP